MSHALLRRLGAALVAALLLTAVPAAGPSAALAAAPAVSRSAVAVPAAATSVATSTPVAALGGYRTLAYRGGYRHPLGRGFGRGFFIWWIVRSALRGGIGLFILLALVALLAISALQRRGRPYRR